MRFLILIFVVFLSGCYEIESGKKVGNIIKISREGVLFKTYTLTLIRGGINDGSGAFGGAMNFMVEDKRLAEKAQKLMEQKKEVVINFHEEYWCMPCRKVEPFTCRFLDGIE